LILLDYFMDCCSYPHFNPRIESEHCTVEASRASEKKEKEKKDKERKEREPASAAGVSLCFYLFFLFVSNSWVGCIPPPPRERGAWAKRVSSPSSIGDPNPGIQEMGAPITGLIQYQLGVLPIANWVIG
jgi:hypothetical protein